MPVLCNDKRLSTNLLGDSYPYWWIADGDVHWANFADEAMEEFPVDQRRIDPVAVLSILSFEYICLDRTLVQGLSRLPWLGAIDASGVVRFAEAPPHGNRQASAEEIADGFYRRYRRELLDYIEGYDHIYLLLSGGMDSRVMAGTLRQLQREGRVDTPIAAVTWGVEDCRDVVYARQLAEHFGWDWHYAPLTSETYWDNFELGATVLGAENDPKHLHRMDWFENAIPNSVVLAASYGDSVGRAEFSSRHLLDIQPLEPNDRSRLLAPNIYSRVRSKLLADIQRIRTRHGARSNRGWLEIERQCHYMRRHLCATMDIINRWTDLKQSFVTPEVFGYLWSFDPKCRTDEVYTQLLRKLDSALLDVPWARTGTRYDGSDDNVDRQHRRAFHRYGYWLRTDHADKICDLLFDGTLRRLKIFDIDQVRWMFHDWQRERPQDDTSLCTQISSLAALSIFADRFELQECEPVTDSSGPKDRIEGVTRRQLARLSQMGRRVSRPWRMRIGELY